MPAASYKVSVLIGGSALPDEVAHLLHTVDVDLSTNLPSMFVLTFADHGRTVTTKARPTIGGEVVIKVSSDTSSSPVTLFKGEITAIEIDLQAGSAVTIIRGFDRAHLLLRGNVQKTYTQVKASDVVSSIANEVGLTAEADATTTVFPVLIQAGVSNWTFLQDLARESGRDLWVEDKKLLFKKPKPASQGPSVGTGAPQDHQVIFGHNLTRLRGTVTASDQVKTTHVRGWDPLKKAAVVGTSSAATTSAVLTLTPAAISAKVGNKSFTYTDVPAVTQSEADALAKSIAHHLGAGHAELEGEVTDGQALKPGTAISLGGAGAPFDGKYTLTTVHHTWDDHGGFRTSFTVTGPKERTLLALTSGGGPAASNRIEGLRVGIVTDLGDPDKKMRVKVKLPWLGDDVETGWCRVVQPGAGKDHGMQVMPLVNDEVLVAFEEGDPRHGYVVGGLYNGVDTPFAGTAAAITGGSNDKQSWTDRNGAELALIAKGGSEGVLLTAKGDSYKLHLNKGGQTVLLHSDGTVTIEAKQGMQITAQSDLTLSSKSGKISIEASAGDVSIKGLNVTAEASVKASMKGATAEVEGTATASVKAALVQLG